MRYFLDTEFNEDGTVLELISLALVSEIGHSLYLESNEFDESTCTPFVQQHVLLHLGPKEERLSRAQMSERIHLFLANDSAPSFWAYFAAYDWVLFCQLFGPMVDLPRPYPQYCLDLKQLEVMLPSHLRPEKPVNTQEHHALADAGWNRQYFEVLWEAYQDLGLPR